MHKTQKIRLNLPTLALILSIVFKKLDHFTAKTGCDVQKPFNKSNPEASQSREEAGNEIPHRPHQPC